MSTKKKTRKKTKKNEGVRLLGAMMFLCVSIACAFYVFKLFDMDGIAMANVPDSNRYVSSSQLSGVSDGEEPSTEPTSESTSTAATTSTAAQETTTAKTMTKPKTTTEKSTTASTAPTTTVTLPNGAKNNDYVYKPNYQTDYYIVVYTGSQSVAVYGKDENGAYTQLVRCFTCSSGTNSTPTYGGLYAIHTQYRWRVLMGGVYGQYSSAFSKGYLFHSVPYRTNDESTLYENMYKKLGSKASHGCVRLCTRDAKWIYDNCEVGTQVYVTTASGPAGAPIPELVDEKLYRGWDPSDPNPKNPYVTDPPGSGETEETTTTATTTTTAATTDEEATTTGSADETTTTTAAEPNADAA